MDDIVYFYIAYTIIWFGIFVYMVKMHADQRRLAREIEVLEEVLDVKRGAEE
jgi:CcmD family protein